MDQNNPDKLLMELFPSQSSVVTTPRGDDFIDTSLLHPELAKMTLPTVLNQSSKGRQIMQKVEEAGDEEIDRKLLLSMANLLREPIMKFCEKPGFPTRNEQRVFLKHLFDPYPALSLQMFVSNKKQQSGLLENSIRNARRRAKRSDEESDSESKEVKIEPTSSKSPRKLVKKRKSAEKTEIPANLVEALTKLAEKLPKNVAKSLKLNAESTAEPGISMDWAKKLGLAAKLAEELKNAEKSRKSIKIEKENDDEEGKMDEKESQTSVEAETEENLPLAAEKLKNSAENHENTSTLAEKSLKRPEKSKKIEVEVELEDEEDHELQIDTTNEEISSEKLEEIPNISAGLAEILGLAEKHLARDKEMLQKDGINDNEAIEDHGEPVSPKKIRLDSPEMTSEASVISKNSELLAKFAELCSKTSPNTSDGKLELSEELETPSKKNVKLSQELLDVTIESLLEKTPSGLAVLGRLRGENELQRPDYLYMANMIREPIMKLCERPSYPSRYEQRAFLEHIFRDFPQVDIPVFVGNRKQTLGCLENSIRNGRRSKKMKEHVKEAVEVPKEPVEEVTEVEKLTKMLFKEEKKEKPKSDVKVRQIARYQRHGDVSVDNLHPEIRSLTIEELLTPTHKGQVLLAMLEANLPLDSADCAKLALMIREPIMKHAETPNRPSRVELRAYFQHLLGRFTQLEMTDFVCNRKQVHGHLEKSIRNAKRVINKKAARRQMVILRNAAVQAQNTASDKVLVLPDLTTIQLPSTINLNSKLETKKRADLLKKKYSHYKTIYSPTVFKKVPGIGLVEAGSALPGEVREVAFRPHGNTKLNGIRLGRVGKPGIQKSTEDLDEDVKEEENMDEKVAKEEKETLMTSKIPVESYDLHENLKEMSIQSLLGSTLPGRILLHQIEDESIELKKQELTEFCKYIRDPLMRFCERSYYPRRHEMRAFLIHLFEPYPKMMNYLRDLVCDKKQILGILEDNIHCVRRRLRGKGALPPPALEPNLNKTFVGQGEDEQGPAEPIEDDYETANPTSMLLQATMNAISMQEQAQTEK
ncbi:unnamed protein product [Bursaphelenchus xylophilus]|uniref:(pine wood nematode) hypothetical protein n=1 Tax=Bursaphelenchus xylophilus TaxID=6326 RepID=A0A1I7RV13_BURXY|nr:unnamed protein product [Bursaphelenchus xylophilus]CAG9105217.1 unnamed protein product [Bursaphelenchus xylophilus]